MSNTSIKQAVAICRVLKLVTTHLVMHTESVAQDMNIVTFYVTLLLSFCICGGLRGIQLVFAKVKRRSYVPTSIFSQLINSEIIIITRRLCTL